MRCPTLNELPPPPLGKIGWPWTEESPRLPSTMPDGSEWPWISIVTPNYNYGHFLEETMRSVLLQGYPNLEYIVIDGGSTDNSVEIIQKYAPWLSYWVSEKDKGQASAINKGIKKCTGSIFNWINSDDFLATESLKVIAEEMGEYDMLAGVVCNFDDKRETLIQNANLSSITLVLNQGAIFHQPGIWLKLDRLKSIENLSEKFRYCFDWDLMIKYLARFSHTCYTSRILVYFRLHETAKTINESSQMWREREKVLLVLRRNKDYQNLHLHAEFFIKQKQWQRFLKKIVSSQKLSKIQKATKIIQKAIWDPRIKWSRFTLGAIRKSIQML